MELVLHRLCYIWLHRYVIRCKLWQQYDTGGHWYPDSGGSQEDLSTQRPASASSPTSTAASTRWLDWKPKFETFSTGDLWIHVAELPSEFLRSPLQVSIGRKQVSIKKSSQLIFQVSPIYGKDVLYIFRLPMLMILSFFAAPQTLLVPDIGSTVAGATFL